MTKEEWKEISKIYDGCIAIIAQMEGGRSNDIDITDRIASILVEHEELEMDEKVKEWIPMVKRPTGRTIPDLTKREHICEWQSTVSTKEARVRELEDCIEGILNQKDLVSFAIQKQLEELIALKEKP